MINVFNIWMCRCKRTDFGFTLPRDWNGLPHDDNLRIRIQIFG